MSEDTKGLNPHPIVAKLAADPAAPLDAVQFVGYVGKSTRPDHHRLYSSLQLDEYIDIPFAAVVHHEDVPDTEIPHGGTRVWVDASAAVVHEVRQTTRTEARFLEGAIADQYLQEAPEEPGAFARPYTYFCVTNEAACTEPSRTVSCACCPTPTRTGDRCTGDMFGAPATFPGCQITRAANTCAALCTRVFTQCPNRCISIRGQTCFVPSCVICTKALSVCATCMSQCICVTKNVHVCGVAPASPGCPVNTAACPAGTAACPVTPGCPIGPEGGPIETSGPTPSEASGFGAGYGQGYGYHDPYADPGSGYRYRRGYPPWRR